MSVKMGHVTIDENMNKRDMLAFLRRYFTEISDLGDTIYAKQACKNDTFALDFDDDSSNAELYQIRLVGNGAILWEAT